MGEAEVVPADEKQADSGINPIENSVVWSQEVEVCLFHAMLGHKPVGLKASGCSGDVTRKTRQEPAIHKHNNPPTRVNRHFHMICIRDKFSQNIGRQVSSKVIWDHLGTMYDMSALHESEILPFPNSEKSFNLPDEIIEAVKEGKLVSEDDMKDDFKEDQDPPAMHEEGSNSSVKMTERAVSKDKDRERDREKGSAEGGPGKEAADKRKRNRATEKVLNSSSNPSSPGGAKRRRT